MEPIIIVWLFSIFLFGLSLFMDGIPIVIEILLFLIMLAVGGVVLFEVAENWLQQHEMLYSLIKLVMKHG